MPIQISSTFCADNDLILDPTNDSNRTTSNNEDMENSAFHHDTIVDHRINLSDMETQFPVVNMQFFALPIFKISFFVINYSGGLSLPCYIFSLSFRQNVGRQPQHIFLFD